MTTARPAGGFPRRRLLSLAAGAALAGLPAGAQAESDDPGLLYAALRGRPDVTLAVGGGELDIVFQDGAPGVDRAPVVGWIRSSAVAVATYFGRFPVRRVGLLVVGQDGGRVGHATTYGLGTSAIRIHVGRRAGPAAFAEDWVLVHEMVHLALPSVPRRSLWLQEGNAVYVEPIARAQAGQLDEATVWRWSLRNMASGLPGPGDGGLDHTASHDRIYWGGAIFWLLAEVAIDRRTSGRHTLRDALRAINRASGGNVADWTAERVMAAGDTATGVAVLGDLYAAMKDAPVHTDLPALFASLGVGESGGRVVFDDAAPLADLRRRITRREGLRPSSQAAPDR